MANNVRCWWDGSNWQGTLNGANQQTVDAPFGQDVNILDSTVGELVVVKLRIASLLGSDESYDSLEVSRQNNPA